ncbi:hypothetical protein BXZ70DRAFT_898497, partial [Cristinia sonorae]
MATFDDNPGYQPFIDHLIAALSVYELGTVTTPVPHYNGPIDWKTTSISRSIQAIARRMRTAEEAYNTIKAAES